MTVMKRRLDGDADRVRGAICDGDPEGGIAKADEGIFRALCEIIMLVILLEATRPRFKELVRSRT
jgi:hypothetical protein